MSLGEPLDFKPCDYTNNCRFCFRPFTEEQKTITISEIIETKFRELCQLELIKDVTFSTSICVLCDSDLEMFSNFRTNLIEKQKKLYGARTAFQHVKSEQEDVQVKAELEDFVSSVSVFADTCFVDIDQQHDESPLPSLKGEQSAKTSQTVFEDEEHQNLFDELKAIMKLTKEKRIQCPRCFKLMHRDSIKEHVTVVHLKQRKFRCDICGYEASRQSRLQMHLHSAHNFAIDEKPKKQCTHCGTMVRDMRRHLLKVHMSIKNFFCDLCPFGAFFKYDLEQHMKTHQRKVKEIEKYFCETCGLEFQRRFHLNAHRRAKHTVKERIHQCAICEKSFFTAENLKKHAESHEARDKPCEFCGKLFTCMNNLRTHLYYHASPKFICDFPNCDKKFYMKKRLRAHLKSHKGQKDFVCEACDKGYFSQNDLNRHTFSIHKKLRFFCQANGCHGNFSRREYYKKHVLAHHQDLGQDSLEQLLQAVKDAQPLQRS